MENAHIPQAVGLMLRARLRLPVNVPYTLTDMARDCVGLMDALGIERAHLVGASMGGMIGQIVAAKFGERLLSFTSIMSSSGNPRIPGASPDVVRAMVKRSLSGEKPDLASSMALWRKIGSPAYQPTDAQLKKKILDSWQRSDYREGYPPPGGGDRQWQPGQAVAQDHHSHPGDTRSRRRPGVSTRRYRYGSQYPRRQAENF